MVSYLFYAMKNHSQRFMNKLESITEHEAFIYFHNNSKNSKFASAYPKKITNLGILGTY